MIDSRWKSCWVLPEIDFLATEVCSVKTNTPRAIYLNETLAQNLSINPTSENVVRHFGHFEALPNCDHHLKALAYHGHQFQHYNPQLGDGRGFSFAQFKDAQQVLRELGTKGSGTTPYSRQGDGRLTLKGAVREALATAYLNFLELDSSLTLSIVETEQPLTRNDEPSPTRSAILVRVCKGHLRIGTFQRLRYLNEDENIAKLIQYSRDHLNFAKNKSVEHWLLEVSDRVAKMTAQWMIYGFVHGVLNTDNINITGESFDYGPYRFLPHYDPEFTAAYFDHQKLYAFGRQPQIMLWNLHQLYLSIESHLENFDFALCIERFRTELESWAQYYFKRRLGIIDLEPALQTETSKSPLSINNLMTDIFAHLYKTKEDFQSFFFQRKLNEQILNSHGFSQLAHLNSIQENLLYNEIEEIWRAIDERDDWSLFNNKLHRLNAKNGLQRP